MAIYDSLVFFNELELLDLRFHELNDVVHRFVIVEAERTYTGLDKPLYFDQNRSLFKPYLDKVIHVVVENSPSNPQERWAFEHFQRRAISRGLKECHVDDVIMIADADEIHRAKTIAAYRPEEGPKILFELFCYYYMNCVTVDDWTGPRIMSYGYFLRQGADAQQMRWRKWPGIKNAGWHFSYLGGVDRIKQKLDSFSHQELNIPEFTSRERLEKVLKEPEDIFKRPIPWKLVDIDESWPDYVLQNRDQFKQFISPTLN